MRSPRAVLLALSLVGSLVWPLAAQSQILIVGGKVLAPDGESFVDHTVHIEGKRIRAVAPEPVSAYFGELTRVWQAVAYADQTPAESRVQALCDGWREHFGMTS